VKPYSHHRRNGGGRGKTSWRSHPPRNRNSASILSESAGARDKNSVDSGKGREAALKVRLRAVLAVSTFAFVALSLPTLAQEDSAPPQNSFGPRVNPQQPAQAQRPPQQQMPAPEVVATHGDWKIQCEAPPANAQGAPAQKQCGMIQTARSDKNPKVGLTLVLVKGQQNGKAITMMRIMAPVGVYLPTGVALEVDGGAVGRVPFTRCLPQVCIAFAEATRDTLDKLKKGTAANFIIYEAPGLGLPLKISLNGFSAAYGALDNL
jgi:invasion protein IalB